MAITSQQQGGTQIMGQDDSSVRPEHALARAADAFDAGLAFAWNHKRRLLQGGFLAGLVEIVLTYIQDFLRLSQQEVFLVLMAGVGATSWLMTYAGLYCLHELRGTQLPPAKLFLRSLQSMPKIVLSYIVLVAIAMALFAFPPLLILAVFGLWAPAFCVTELFALPLKEQDEPPDDAFDDDVVYRKVIRFRFFQGRPLWDLGFARSIAFVGQNFALSLQFSLFTWAVTVLPAGAMLLFSGYYPSFSSRMLETLVSSFLEVLLLGAGMVSFLVLLPQEARAEIGFPVAEDLIRNIPRENVPEILQFKKKKYPVLVVMLLGLLSTQLTWNWFKHQHTMPASVQVSLENVQMTKDRLIVTMQLVDDQQLYRWLDPNSLRMQLVSIPVSSIPASGIPVSTNPAPGSSAASNPAPTVNGLPPAAIPPVEAHAVPSAAISGEQSKEPSLIQPERVMPFGVDGTPLEEASFTPYGRPLRLVLYFARPPANSGKFLLYHRSLFGLGKPILDGEFSSGDKAVQGVQDGKPA